MRDIKITKILRLTDGKVRLTDKQAKGRDHKLVKVDGKKDVYEITATNEFKVGQEIGFSGPFPKGLANHVEFLDGLDIDGNKPGEKKSKKPETPAPTITDIVRAIASLNPDKKKLWTSAGVPQVKGLEKVLGYNITAEERDAAWELYQQHDDIVEAIGMLDPDNAEEWTQDKQPDVKALEILLERDITAGQRDLAWALYQEINK